MASSKPFVRQVSWISLIPNFILFVFLVFLIGRIAPPAIAGYLIVFLYLFIILALRSIPVNHRRGIKYFKAERYEEALSSSRISYTEMALLNIAFLYAQTGQGVLAKEYYEKTLAQFPDSEMAKSALRMLHSLANVN